MRRVEVDDDTYEKLLFGARVAGLTVPELVRRLVAPGQAHKAVHLDLPQENPSAGVFVSYRGRRVEGMFDIESERLSITDGPVDLVGRTFKSPTKAAVEVVKAINPYRQAPQTNGWKFWRATDSGQVIDQVYRSKQP